MAEKSKYYREAEMVLWEIKKMEKDGSDNTERCYDLHTRRRKLKDYLSPSEKEDLRKLETELTENNK